MSKRLFFCGNWKLWGNLTESVALARAVADGVAGITGTSGTAEVAVAPGFVALVTVAAAMKGGLIGVAAQDCHFETKGAFTGEVAAAQIADAGCRYVIVGHSERRMFFDETDETVNRKARAALAAGLAPIICVGESLAERDSGKATVRVGAQLDGALRDMADKDILASVIAYEPVWAIGTGRNATPAQAQEVHAFIRERVAARVGAAAAKSVRILYGGSVKPDNVAGLMAQTDIDGALVGGASLTVDSFVKLVKEGTAACTES